MCASVRVVDFDHAERLERSGGDGSTWSMAIDREV
jgi:hypothetical protein